MISRLQISLARAINKSTYLPEYIIIVLEDDIMEFLEYRNYGVSAMYGTWLDWLVKEFSDLISAKQKSLPTGARNENDTQMYWATAVYHELFSLNESQMREKFNNCMETAVKAYDNMRVIKIKEAWDDNNMTAVVNNRITSSGLTQLWKGTDSAFKFNLIKREEFLIREKFRAQQASRENARNHKRHLSQGDTSHRMDNEERNTGNEAKMNRLVRNCFHSWVQQTRFQWKRPGFTLPKPPAKE